jgi:hypothetical protein
MLQLCRERQIRNLRAAPASMCRLERRFLRIEPDHVEIVAGINLPQRFTQQSLLREHPA